MLEIAPGVGLAVGTRHDDALMAGMVANPIVIGRPMVVNGDKAALGRPPESVADIL